MLARAPLLPPRHASIFVLETNEKSGVDEANGARRNQADITPLNLRLHIHLSSSHERRTALGLRTFACDRCSS